MLAKIDKFFFEIDKTDIQKISHRINFGWSQVDRIGGHFYTQAHGQWEETVEFSGRLLMQSVSTVKDLIETAKAKAPVRLSLGTGESFMVVIDAIEQEKSSFLRQGEFRVQEYRITIKRYFE